MLPQALSAAGPFQQGLLCLHLGNVNLLAELFLPEDPLLQLPLQVLYFLLLRFDPLLCLPLQESLLCLPQLKTLLQFPFNPLPTLAIV